MTPETTIARRWLYGRLSGDATLQATFGSRFYDDPVPQDELATFPRLLWSHMTSEDVRGVNNVRFYVNVWFIVRGIIRDTDITALEAAMSRVDALLDHAEDAAVMTVTGGVVLACHRERPFEEIEAAEDGTIYRHQGGVYVLSVQSTS